MLERSEREGVGFERGRRVEVHGQLEDAHRVGLEGHLGASGVRLGVSDLLVRSNGRHLGGAHRGRQLRRAQPVALGETCGTGGQSRIGHRRQIRTEASRPAAGHLLGGRHHSDLRGTRRDAAQSVVAAARAELQDTVELDRLELFACAPADDRRRQRRPERGLRQSDTLPVLRELAKMGQDRGDRIDHRPGARRRVRTERRSLVPSARCRLERRAHPVDQGEQAEQSAESAGRFQRFGRQERPEQHHPAATAAAVPAEVRHRDEVHVQRSRQQGVASLLEHHRHDHGELRRRRLRSTVQKQLPGQLEDDL